MVLTDTKQHLVLSNLLINASCVLTKVDMRFITSLLARTRQQGLEFRGIHIPVQEVLAFGRRKLSSKDYTNLTPLQLYPINIRLRLVCPDLASG